MKPSRYLLLTFAVFGAVLWSTDRWPFDGGEKGRGSGPVVVKRDSSPGPRPVVRDVSGRVLDALGWPVEGAEVRRVDGFGERLTTGEDGRFRLRVEGAAPVDLVVAAESYRTVHRRLFPSLGDPVTFQLEPVAPWDSPTRELERMPPGNRAGEGFVRDPAGAPLAGALVTVMETGFCARTDDIGRYIVALPDGPATLLVHAPAAGDRSRGLAARSEVLQPVRREGLVPLPELRAFPASRVRGTVLDPDGNPVSGAPVVVRGQGFLRHLETDTDGVFSLAGLLTGRFELVGLAYRGSLGFRNQVELGPAGIDTDFHLRADPARRLRVVDQNERAVPSAHVAVNAEERRRWLARTDAEGWVELRGIAQDATFEVRRGDLELEVLTARPDEGTLVVSLP